MGRYDWWVLLSVVGLLGVGAISVMSGSSVVSFKYTGDSYYFFKRHVLWIAVGFITMVYASTVDYHRILKHAKLIFLFTLFLLVLVFLPKVGRSVMSAHRWIHLGFLSFQPSELSKLALILYLVDFVSRKKEKLNSIREGIVPMMVASLLVIGLVGLEPDLGVSAVLLSLLIAVWFAGGTPLRYILSVSAVFGGIVWAAIFFLGYGKRRILSFLDPWKYQQGAGFQAVQSLIAFGMGGIWGTGLGAGRQKFLYLPAQQTDFIFTVVGEELGMIGALGVLGLYAILGYRGLKIALSAPDFPGYLLAVSIVFAMLLQAFINIAMVLGLLPITGITLPFMSFGGSSMVVYMLMVGILLNIGRQSTE